MHPFVRKKQFFAAFAALGQIQPFEPSTAGPGFAPGAEGRLSRSSRSGWAVAILRLALDLEQGGRSRGEGAKKTSHGVQSGRGFVSSGPRGDSSRLGRCRWDGGAIGEVVFHQLDEAIRNRGEAFVGTIKHHVFSPFEVLSHRNDG